MKIRKTLNRSCSGLCRLVARGRERGNAAGMATAEYAVGLIAAVGFAGLLIVIMKSPEMKALLFGIVKKALSV
jgi:hypothetical protein